MTDRTTRAERMSQPHLREVITAVAEEHGACIRPLQFRKTNLDTGQAEQVLIPCGATLASVCPSCAARAKTLRAAQCREGWHLEHEPITAPGPPGDWQCWLAATLADLLADRDQAAEHGADAGDLDDQIDAITAELHRTSPARAAPAAPASPKPGASAPLAAARTPPTCPAARSPAAPSAGPSLPETARPTGPRCSSPSPATATARSATTARRRHVRIPESALGEFIDAGMVEPSTRPRRRRTAA